MPKGTHRHCRNTGSRRSAWPTLSQQDSRLRGSRLVPTTGRSQRAVSSRFHTRRVQRSMRDLRSHHPHHFPTTTNLKNSKNSRSLKTTLGLMNLKNSNWRTCRAHCRQRDRACRPRRATRGLGRPPRRLQLAKAKGICASTCPYSSRRAKCGRLRELRDLREFERYCAKFPRIQLDTVRRLLHAP